MKTFSMNVTNMPNNTIGFGGENGVTEVVLDFGAWAEEYGQGAISLLVKRAMDTHPYPAVLETEGTTATWVITDVETSYKGHGEAQWIYTVGEQIKKSAVFGFNVNRSLNSPVAETPEAYQTWVDDMIALGAGVEQIAEQVYEATGHYPKVENGYWYVWSVVEEDWVNTNQKAQGEQGIPGVGISSTVLNPDYTLTITFTDGSSYTTPPIRGEKGDTGNGIFSTVLNADYTLTITFTNGTTYTTPSIRGVPGQDYVITSADYDEIAGRVDTMIATERQQALDDIDEAKTNAVSDVTLEGTTQKGLVTSEGTTQKGLVTAEGTTQVGLVTAKGQEVIQSIPSDYSELSDDVSELKADFTHLENDKADMIISSASGAIASFADGANYPVKKTVFEMNPVQDLHGQEYPYPAGGGENLFPYAGSGMVSGVTYTTESDGTVILNGLCTSSANIIVYFTLKAGTYILCDFADGTFPSNTSARTQVYSPVNSKDIVRINISTHDAWSNPLTFDNDDATVQARIRVDSGFNYQNCKLKPILAKSTYTGSYAPYSNICPILGHTEVDAHVSPTTDSADGTTVTYTLGQTVYAGTLTINEDGSGQIISTSIRIDPKTCNAVYQSANGLFYAILNLPARAADDYTTASFDYPLSNMFRKGSGVVLGRCYITNAGNNLVYVHTDQTLNTKAKMDAWLSENTLQFWYRLRDPITINLTEQEVIETLYGNNNIWHDANGDTEVTYRADTKLYIDNKFAELQTLIANL